MGPQIAIALFTKRVILNAKNTENIGNWVQGSSHVISNVSLYRGVLHVYQDLTVSHISRQKQFNLDCEGLARAVGQGEQK